MAASIANRMDTNQPDKDQSDLAHTVRMSVKIILLFISVKIAADNISRRNFQSSAFPTGDKYSIIYFMSSEHSFLLSPCAD